MMALPKKNPHNIELKYPDLNSVLVKTQSKVLIHLETYIKTSP